MKSPKKKIESFDVEEKLALEGFLELAELAIEEYTVLQFLV